MNPCVGILRHECLIISCLVRIVSNPSASCHLGHCSVACRTKQCRAKYWIASSLSSDDTRSLQAIHICIIIFGEAHSVSHSSSYTARYSSSSPTVGRRLGDFQELTSSRYFFFEIAIWSWFDEYGFLWAPDTPGAFRFVSCVQAKSRILFMGSIVGDVSLSTWGQWISLGTWGQCHFFCFGTV